MSYSNRQWITFSLFLAVSLLGCTSNGEQTVRNQLKTLTASTEETIDLSRVGSSTWSRLCILTPYSDNPTAEELLGFEWDAEEKTNIQLSDSITVLIFASDDAVETYVAYPRGEGNFSPVGSSCFERDDAKFARKQKDGSVSFVVAE